MEKLVPKRPWKFEFRLELKFGCKPDPKRPPKFGLAPKLEALRNPEDWDEKEPCPIPMDAEPLPPPPPPKDPRIWADATATSVATHNVAMPNWRRIQRL